MEVPGIEVSVGAIATLQESTDSGFPGAKLRACVETDGQAKVIIPIFVNAKDIRARGRLFIFKSLRRKRRRHQELHNKSMPSPSGTGIVVKQKARAVLPTQKKDAESLNSRRREGYGRWGRRSPKTC